MKNDRFYKANEEITIRFYQVPKVLFTNPKYKGLSIGAKLLYGILRDRQELSMQNNWIDEDGNIYLIFTEENLGELIDSSEKTARKYKKELIKYELLYEKRIGQGRANRKYILKPELIDNDIYTKKGKDVDNAKNGKKFRSKTVKSSVPEGKNLPANETDSIDTDLIETDLKDFSSSCSDSEESNEESKNKFDVKIIALTNLLINKIVENNDRASVPKEGTKNYNDWCTEIDRLHRLGPVGAKDKGYIINEIRDIIIWCQEDSFWKDNILSAGKLREKVVKLENKMKSSSNQNTYKKKKNNFHVENNRTSKHDNKSIEKKISNNQGNIKKTKEDKLKMLEEYRKKYGENHSVVKMLKKELGIE